jgi:hypothetical protein
MPSRRYKLESIRQGQVCHWRPSRGPTGNVLYDSVRGHHGTLTNGSVWQASAGANSGYALKFNGTNSHVAFPTGVINYVNGPYTLSAWYNISATSSLPMIFSNGAAADTYELRLSGSTNQLEMLHGYPNPSYVVATAPSASALNQWHLGTAVFDGTSVKLYQNGRQVASSATTLSPSFNTMSIGGRGASFSFNGSLDDLFISRRPLNASEVLALYQAGRGGLDEQVKRTVVRGASLNPEVESTTPAIKISSRYTLESIRSGLIGYWRPSRGPTGNVLLDSINGRHGTVEGGAEWTSTPGGGNSGYALKCDGVNDRVSIPRVENAVAGLTTLTLSCWVHRPASASKQQFGWGRFDSIAKRATVQWFTDNKIYLAFENGLPTSFPSFLLNATGWHHLCVTYDGSRIGDSRVTLWVNGNWRTLSPGGGSPTASLASGLGDLNLGWDNVSGFCTGSYDDLFVSSRVLSGSEVRTLYQAGRGALDKQVTRTFGRGFTGISASGFNAVVTITEDPDTVSATSVLAIAAVASQSEPGDTVTSTAIVGLKANASITEADDTVSATASGVVTSLGTVSITEANDTVTSTATVLVKATASITEASDLNMATATLLALAAVAIADAADTVSATATVLVKANASITESNDTVTATSTVVSNAGATVSITEANDVVTSTATVKVAATCSQTDADDTVTFASRVAVKATTTILEPGDSVVSTGTVVTLGSIKFNYYYYLMRG